MKRLVPHNPHWKVIFEQEATLLSRLLQDHATAIHHMGSTAIANLPAKPTIDILLETPSLAAIDSGAEILCEHHYVARGEYGIAGRRYFKKAPIHDTPSFHLHCYEASSYQIKRHLAFRDFLRLKPALARDYATLKDSLSDDDGVLAPTYQDAKKPWVDEMSLRAMRYYSSR